MLPIEGERHDVWWALRIRLLHCDVSLLVRTRVGLREGEIVQVKKLP